MKKLLLAMLLLGVAPAVLADCDSSCSSDNTCCKNVKESCEPNGCCPTDCEALDVCDCAVEARSFFRVRPQFQGASPEKVSMWRLGRIYAREDGKYGSFQVVPFGGRTGKSRRLASYFMPFCKSELVVAENPDVERDIDATAFNIFTTDGDFKSTICFRPQQSTAGVGLSWRQRLSRSDEPKGFWFEISMPITHVRNEINLSETVESTGSGVNTTLISFAQPNMTTAFQQERFNYGRIECDCNDDLTKTGLADVDLRIGYGWQQEDMCHVESYLGVLIPTGNKVKGCRMFEAIVGHDHHVGFEFGNAGGFRIWANEEKEREIWVETAIHSIYLNKNTQRRSFDARYNPWSRYLPVYSNFAAAQAANNAGVAGIPMYTSGINEFTKDVEVSGRFQRTYNTAFVFNGANFSAEAGYNFFCRDAECVELCSNWSGTVAFIDCNAQNDIDTGFVGIPTKLRTIRSCNSPADVPTLDEDYYNARVVKQADLDLNSAAAPCQSQHTLYLNLGYRWDEISYPTFIGLGGSYEFAPNNTGLNRWLVWGKVGVSY